MLALLGVLTIVFLLYLIMSKKTSAVVALILVPLATGLAGGFGTELFGFMTNGIRSIAPTGAVSYTHLTLPTKA